MIKVKTMTEWPDEDYSYPLPDVSQYSEKERRKLTFKGIRFMVFGERRHIKSDEEFEVCITLAAFDNWHEYVDRADYKDDVMRDVEHNRFLWYHGRRLSALRKERMKPFIKELVDEVRYGPMFDGAFLYRVELGRFRCMREYFSYSFVADEDGCFSFKPWMDICIRLLEYIVEEGHNISDEQRLHVNVCNVHDIVDQYLIDGYINAPLPSEAKEGEPDKAFYGRQIYLRKAERLYYSIRLNKIHDWWEP
ncbi:MAG TPA: hypothetical protein IAA77_06660 [Candidatus Avibacteroides excrementipullorum]|nr:hypothetical protein [Candidatus Avibacteroides excrementipullorum]